MYENMIYLVGVSINLGDLDTGNILERGAHNFVLWSERLAVTAPESVNEQANASPMNQISITHSITIKKILSFEGK
jgi:hypothetical protein